MKGVITAAGLGSRLFPLTHVTSKQLLPIYNKPMIFYPIETLVKAGVNEIMIVVGGPHAGHFMSILRNGKELGIKHLEFVYQEQQGGTAQAIALAESFADNEDLVVIYGDNLTDADISNDVKKFSGGAKVFLKKVSDPRKYGVASFNKKDKSKIDNIAEKPSSPASDFAVTGIYLYDHKVFDFIRNVKPSVRGELEITDANNEYIKRGEMQWAPLDGYWTDAGTFDTLLEANNYWSNKNK